MAVADRDELSGRCKSVSEYIVETDHMHNISLSLAKPGEAMPGPYSSLMVLRRRASRSGEGRAVRGRKTQRSTPTFYFKQRQCSVARAAARCMPLSGADPSVSRVHAGIVM